MRKSYHSVKWLKLQKYDDEVSLSITINVSSNILRPFVPSIPNIFRDYEKLYRKKMTNHAHDDIYIIIQGVCFRICAREIHSDFVKRSNFSTAKIASEQSNIYLNSIYDN